MKSRLRTICCAVGLLLCTSSLEAAPIHGDYEQDPLQTRHEWFSILHQRQNAENPFALASEKFRSIPQGKIVSLSFGEEKNDPLGLISSGFSGSSNQFNNKWIGLLFGMKSWEIDEDSSIVPLSAHPTSAIPLPASFYLFIAGLGGILLLGWLRKRPKKSSSSV